MSIVASASNVEEEEDVVGVDCVFDLTKLAYNACNQQERMFFNSIPTTPKIDVKVCCELVMSMKEYHFETSGVITLAILYNHMHCLKIALKQGLVLPIDCLKHAMATGSLDLVKFLIKQGSVFKFENYRKRTFYNVKSHLSFISYFHNDACQLKRDFIRKSVTYGTLEFFSQMHDDSCDWNSYAFMMRLGRTKNLALEKVYLFFHNCYIWTPTYNIEIIEGKKNQSHENLDCNIDLIKGIIRCMDYIDEKLVANSIDEYDELIHDDDDDDDNDYDYESHD